MTALNPLSDKDYLRRELPYKHTQKDELHNGYVTTDFGICVEMDSILKRLSHLALHFLRTALHCGGRELP